MIECGCGCGTLITRISHFRERRFVVGHNGRKPERMQPCAHCGAKYPFRQSGTRYCSRACSSTARAVAKVELVCLVCGEDYMAFPYRAEASKYCSKECWSSRKPAVNCLACGTEFVPRGTVGKYCSRFCAKTHMVGERAAQWKGGLTLANERARRSTDLRKWRLAVYKRDGYRCQDCGTRTELHAHHIKFWSTHPELRFEVSNGVTVCIDCHGKRHGRNLRKFRRKSYGPTRVPAPALAKASRPPALQLALFDLSTAG